MLRLFFCPRFSLYGCAGERQPEPSSFEATCFPQDVAFEGYEEHGVFTYALLAGLRGAADRPERDGRRDQVISIDELSDYLQQEVSDHAPEVP